MIGNWAGHSGCPEVCQCLNHVIDCSGKNLSKIPNDLNYNVELLNLSNNNLTYNESIYPAALFVRLTKLKVLNILGNNHHINSHNGVRFPSALTNITNLEVLLLDGVDEIGFGREFKDLKNLTEIYMDGKRGQCNLTTLPSSFFTHIPSVTRLTITKCSVRSIAKGTFNLLHNLSFLNISYNERLTFRVLENVTSDLATTRIETFDISGLHCDEGPGIVIFENDFVHLENTTSLKNLFVDNNRLMTIQGSLLYNATKQKPSFPSSIRKLSMGGNKLVFGSYVLYIGYMESFEELIMDNTNSHPVFDTDTTIDDMLCNDWRMPPPDSLNSKTTIRIPLTIRKWSCARCALHMVIKDFKNKFAKYIFDVTEYINLRDNLLYQWIGPIHTDVFKRLSYLDLSNNFCNNVSKDFFMFENLKVLLIGQNLLGNVLKDDVDGAIFKQLKRIESIDVSSNGIGKIPRALLSVQTKQKHLNFSNNEIVNFSLDIEHMISLQSLNLSYNQITTIDPYQRNVINKFDNLTIDLIGNVFQCTCDNIEFLDWLKKKRGIFQNFNSYECRFSNGTKTFFDNIDVLLLEMKRNCKSYIVTIVLSTAGLASTIVTVLIGILYRYRWKMRYLYAMAKSRTKLKGYKRLTQEDTNEYSYDAFISYSNDDGLFVRTDVLENLEQAHGIRLCLHQRNFIPGTDIADNIINAIHSSSKTVIVMSPNYLNSYWCKFEFNMARMESIYSRGGEDILIMVMYEPIDSKDLTLQLIQLMESSSYLEYPEDTNGRVAFWNTLAQSCLE